MKAVKGIIALVCLFVCVSICRSQEVKAVPDLPDFSGIWILDRTKSEPKLTGGSLQNSNTTIVIVQNSLTMTMNETTVTGTDTFVTNKLIIADGRKVSLNKDKIDKNNFVSYRWKGKKLIKEMGFVVIKGDGSNDLDASLNRSGKEKANLQFMEEWTISKDGRTITQIIHPGLMPGISDLPFTLIMKNVYRRKV